MGRRRGRVYCSFDRADLEAEAREALEAKPSVLQANPGFAAVQQPLEADYAALRRLGDRLDDWCARRQPNWSARRPARPRPGGPAFRGATRNFRCRAGRAAAVERWGLARRDSAPALYTTAARQAVADERAASGVGLLFDRAADGVPLAVAAALDLTDRAVARVRVARIAPAAPEPIVVPSGVRPAASAFAPPVSAAPRWRSSAGWGRAAPPTRPAPRAVPSGRLAAPLGHPAVSYAVPAGNDPVSPSVVFGPP
jgi:hypothetical protein